jgi:hypothetical protein
MKELGLLNLFYFLSNNLNRLSNFHYLIVTFRAEDDFSEVRSILYRISLTCPIPSKKVIIRFKY